MRYWNQGCQEIGKDLQIHFFFVIDSIIFLKFIQKSIWLCQQ